MVSIDHQRHDAVLFDLDGVITDTAAVHRAAWKDLFDEYLDQRGERAGEDHSPFTEDDYRREVDGKRRDDGVASFLASRGIEVPLGERSDGEERETVRGLGNRKNRYFRARLERDGVTVFGSTVTLVGRLQEAGVDTAVFSSSRNCQLVLDTAGLGDLFSVRVDGVVADELGLAGKPDPAMLLEAAERLGTEPRRCVVVEDSVAGVEAGRRGGFGLVVGVDRGGHDEGLTTSGADDVVSDLAEVGFRGPQRRLSEVPSAQADDVLRGFPHRQPAFFFDFDGTLADIVDDPDAARPVDGVEDALRELSAHRTVAVVSGRDLQDLHQRIGVEGIWYAGSHGFELRGPDGEHHEHDDAEAARPSLEDAATELEERLDSVTGASVERKRFAVAVHFRKVADGQVQRVTDAVDEVGAGMAALRVTGGRKVRELRPDIPWDKGAAVRWLLRRLSEPRSTVPVYAGDDLTDEDALEAVAGAGLGIVVRSEEHGDRPTAAHVAVDGPQQLRDLLQRLAET